MRMSHEAIVERALVAEDVGFEGIGFMDHMAPPLALEHAMWEAMSIAGWTLAKTSTLRAGHLVLCDAFRHPAVLARQAVSLDHASAGRFELGIGWGSVADEFVTFGLGSTEAPARVARLAESLDVITSLWRGESFDYDGTYFTLRSAQQRPVPTAPIPIVIGGAGRRTLELVDRYADWWNLPIYALQRLEELRPQAGRARVSTQSTVALVADEADRAGVTALVQRRFGRSPMGRAAAIGTTTELIDHFGGLNDRGVDRFYVWFTDFAPHETLERFGAVISALSA
jgi:alkanesulfonate monooxygenase SsuD/methylene tetrahydromethanopterin reductase-like flavin-dependent oxidoreductase (luciferase family)